MAAPMWRSISTIFSTDDVSRREEVMRFSTPRMTPAEVETPMAVLPSLMASREYSTWKRRPSGEKVLGVACQWVRGGEGEEGGRT